MNDREKEILINAYQLIREELGQRVFWDHHLHEGKQAGADAIFQLDKRKVLVNAKNELRPNQVDQVHPNTNHEDIRLVAANYITPKAKEKLREVGINYVDRVGNMWIKIGPVHIHIEGKPNKPPTEDNKNRAFTQTGIKVVFTFLADQTLINTPYRNIAKIAGVALGTIPKVFEGLKQEGYLLKQTENEWFIANFEELLDRWQNEYNKRLKPKLFFKKFKPLDGAFFRNWKNIDLPEGAQWGGEPAADIFTQYLNPEIFTVYTQLNQIELMGNNKWVPDAKGQIKVYRKFWKEEYLTYHDVCVHPLIVYADLMEAGDDRCLETAKLIYERFIQKDH